MNSTPPAITVIVPTRALRERSVLLRRALASVLAQEGVRALPVVVVNGPRRDAQLMASLEQDRLIRVLSNEEESIPAALNLGRSQVDTRWFAELDDDDLLLPGALLARVRALEERADCAAVVTNGLRRDASGDTLNVADFAAVRRDPLRSLVRFNWLLPGSWLCRTSAVDGEVFRNMPPHLECTYLGIRLATTHRTCFLDEPTVVWCTDTPGAASRSREYVLGAESAITRILEMQFPPDVRNSYRRKLANSRNGAARLLLREGNRRAAWRCHLRSLRHPAGWRDWRLTLRLIVGKRSGGSP